MSMVCWADLLTSHVGCWHVLVAHLPANEGEEEVRADTRNARDLMVRLAKKYAKTMYAVGVFRPASGGAQIHCAFESAEEANGVGEPAGARPFVGRSCWASERHCTLDDGTYEKLQSIAGNAPSHRKKRRSPTNSLPQTSFYWPEAGPRLARRAQDQD